MRKIIGAVAIVFGLAGGASAQFIADRPTLDSILSGGYEYTDDFEAYNISDGSATWMNVTELDSTTVVNGQGPGLVDPGVQYATVPGIGGNDNLQWNGANYFGQTSRDILSGTPGIQINYLLPVDAMGVDISDFAGFGDTYTAYIYNGSTLVGTTTGVLSGSGSSFFGWENAGGITAVVFVDSVNSWSPIIDNHSYGFAPLPEPASMSALALGALALLRRRRRS